MPEGEQGPLRHDGAGDLADLWGGITDRVVLADAPGKSGARLERVVIDGQRYVLKRLDLADDWTMRASGCLRGAPLELWERGILARLPGCLNQPIVAVARQPPTARAPSGGCAVLMRDVARWLVPATDEPIPAAQHARFLRHMAALHAAFWGGGAELDIVPAAHRYLELSPWLAEAEAALGSSHLVPRLVARGWPLLEQVAPAAAKVVGPLARDPGPRLAALEECGIDTRPWFDQQLSLCLLGALVQFGWEKALGGYDEELRWWEAQAISAARLLP
jgi:hypothetical protein